LNRGGFFANSVEPPVQTTEVLDTLQTQAPWNTLSTNPQEWERRNKNCA